jgi:nucleoside-diphosphate-sugar epimerase
VARGDAVRALVQPNEDVSRLKSQGVDICYGNMKDTASLTTATKGVSLVLHCAAKTGPWGPQEEYEAINVRGLEALTRAAMAAGVSRLVHVSSITVHGNDVRGVADESAPFHDEPNPYTRTKIAGERLLQRLIRDEGAPVTIVRPGWIYGPRDAASFGRFADMVRRQGMVVIGSGQNHVPLVYVTDVAQGIMQAAVAPQAVGQAYLLVNDERVTQGQYLSHIAKDLGVSPPRRHIPYRFALVAGATAETVGKRLGWESPPPLMRYGLQLLGGENQFVISKARRELGFNPQVSMDEGVRRSVEWFKTR